VNLDDLLQAMDRAAANLAKLDALWERAWPMIPTGPSRGSPREYDDLRRSWSSLLPGLPPIDGWRVTVELPDADGIGQAYIDYLEIGEPAFPVMDAAEEPGRALDEYRFRLAQARRRAIRERLQELTFTINDLLPKILHEVPRNSREVITDSNAVQIADSVSESNVFSVTPPNAVVDGVICIGTCTLAKATTGTTSPSLTGRPYVPTSRRRACPMRTRCRFPTSTSAPPHLLIPQAA
jgi:hypothetical protein